MQRPPQGTRWSSSTIQLPAPGARAPPVCSLALLSSTGRKVHHQPHCREAACDASKNRSQGLPGGPGVACSSDKVPRWHGQHSPTTPALASIEIPKDSLAEKSSKLLSTLIPPQVRELDFSLMYSTNIYGASTTCQALGLAFRKSGDQDSQGPLSS